jgi:hypothetical protein
MNEAVMSLFTDVIRALDAEHVAPFSVHEPGPSTEEDADLVVIVESESAERALKVLEKLPLQRVARTGVDQILLWR